MGDELEQVEKWVGWSRRLWSAALPLLLAVGALAGVDVAGLSDQLTSFGALADRAVTALLALGGAGMALWSFLQPDNAKLRALPGKGSSGGTGPLATVGLVALLLVSCATTPLQRYAQASAAWTAAAGAWEIALTHDNDQFKACRAALRDDCRAFFDERARATALASLERGDALLQELERLAADPATPESALVAVLRELEALTLELQAIYQGGS